MTQFACTAPEKATVPGSRLCSRCKNELWGYLGNDTNITHTPPPPAPLPQNCDPPVWRGKVRDNECLQFLQGKDMHTGKKQAEYQAFSNSPALSA